MDRLSERWFKFTDKTNTIIFSFVFFWGTLVYLTHVEDMVSRYLSHLSNTTGNYGYSALKTMFWIVGLVVDYILIVMPFSVIGMMIQGDKVGDKKRYILRFIRKSFVFWIYLLTHLIP